LRWRLFVAERAGGATIFLPPNFGFLSNPQNQNQLVNQPNTTPIPKPRRQYHFVLQTLTLWSEVATDMFRLWCLAEHDMLLRPNNGYRCV
jgi:hypothetical protein